MILQILTPLVGVMGAFLLSFGAWMIYQPAGYIAGGMLCIVWSWLMAKFLASPAMNSTGGD
ncbi:hypothetical protein K1J46_21495 [Enterobacter hormaechei]|uniref:hypothetical protein n=1 Tax=Enterobacter hormaechei TaxID=158836 RepID=UPI001C644072|nr:hypothetical protein [Enterobacter hormaechei]MBW7765920.1 hypothetical protein [Enterobacter hormaechei]